MRALLAISLCLCALPVSGQSLRGQWDVTSTHPDYRASLLIDAARRATLDGPNDRGKRIQFRGYVAEEQPGVKMVFTEGTIVMRVYCAPETSARLQCYASNHDGEISRPIFLTRVGPGPQTLMPERP